MIVRGVAFAIDVVIAGVVVLFGWLARKGHTWAFGTGIVLYGLDALLFTHGQRFRRSGFPRLGAVLALCRVERLPRVSRRGGRADGGYLLKQQARVLAVFL